MSPRKRKPKTRPIEESTLGPNNDPQFEAVGICHTCARRGDNPLVCEAFPDGIPAAILVGDFLHVQPFKGDHGLQYVRKTAVRSQ